MTVPNPRWENFTRVFNDPNQAREYINFFSSIQESTAGLDDTLAGIEEDIANLQSSISDIETDITSIESDVLILDADVDEVQDILSVAAGIFDPSLKKDSINEIKELDNKLASEIFSPSQGIPFYNAYNERITISEVYAKNSNGLKLFNDDGKGIFIKDSTGYVGILNTNPTAALDVSGYAKAHRVYLSNVSPELLIYGNSEGSSGQLIITPASSNWPLNAFYMPSGAATYADIQVSNASSITNRGRIILYLNGAEAGLVTSYRGTATKATTLKIGEASLASPALASILFQFNGVTKTTIDSAGNFGILTIPAYQLDVNGTIAFREKSSDPNEPSEGQAIIWMSDGTGKGDDGDIMIASKAGGTTNYGTLFDHSAGVAW